MRPNLQVDDIIAVDYANIGRSVIPGVVVHRVFAVWETHNRSADRAVTSVVEGVHRFLLDEKSVDVNAALFAGNKRHRILGREGVAMLAQNAIAMSNLGPRLRLEPLGG